MITVINAQVPERESEPLYTEASRSLTANSQNQDSELNLATNCISLNLLTTA